MEFKRMSSPSGRVAIALGTALVLGVTPAVAQQKAASVIPPELSAHQELSVTRHQVMVAGKRLDYTASTGYLALHDEEGNHRANVYFTAYTKDGVTTKRERPVTFAFNGGPGAASIWLHMGGLGPKRVRMADPGAHTRFDPQDPQLPPFELVSNEHSWLDFTDLIFIDPVGTGYSRAAPGVRPNEFWGYTEDIEYLAEAIRQLTTRFERWGSPKFLAGESYGTTRVSGLSNHLQERHGMHLNGIVLISAVLNFQTIRFAVGNDLPYLLILPTYTATAWYHKRLPAELQQDLERTLVEAEEFALGEYAHAMLMGDKLPAAERARVVAKFARLTGLSPEFVERSNLRISTASFTKELRRSDRRTVGRLDSRFVGIDREAAAERGEYDPSYSGAIMGPFTSMFNDYVRRELKYENGFSYEVRGRVRPWSMAEDGYRNVAEDLRQAMSINPYLRVFVGAGYYDLATPYFGMEYTVATMQLDEAQRGQVDFQYYPSGHMYYIHEPSLVKFTGDMKRFYQATLASSRPTT
jgi:carboxypeptidase C (cathepsin A)